MFKVSSEVEVGWVMKLKEGSIGLALTKTNEKIKKQKVIDVIFTAFKYICNLQFLLINSKKY
jgi:hypothetical protein